VVNQARTFRLAISANLVQADGRLPFPSEFLRPLDSIPNLERGFLTDRTPEITPEQIVGVNALAYGGPPVPASAFSRGADDLVAICCFGIGYDGIDVETCTRAGVAVATARGLTKHFVASGALTAMLALSKRLMDKDRVVREAQWYRTVDVLGDEIQNRVLGIVGLGDIGRELVRLVAPFEMRVLAFDPYTDPRAAEALGVELVTLDYLLASSDFVNLHCNLTAETRGLIGERELGLMKPTAYLINLSRGPVVDHAAVVRALEERRIAGAALDVFYKEPLPIDDPITRLDNVMLSPHSLGSTTPTWRAVVNSVIENVQLLACGEAPRRIVNADVLTSDVFRAKLRRFRPEPALADHRRTN
jgi:phosphoglycerate dehydrogenase-like enzyme